MLPPALPPDVIILPGSTPSSEAFCLHYQAVSMPPVLSVFSMQAAYPFQHIEAIIHRRGELVLWSPEKNQHRVDHPHHVSTRPTYIR
jgi:hypothetical protein